MSDVFISYKREDETRVARLVRALQKSGIDPWWDRGMTGGENWRGAIQTALESAKVVVVAWTHESIGPNGDFVRDEAGHAKARGALVPVLLERVRPPLGFGELQAIDLSGWGGSPRDPNFLDLVAALRAKLEGREPPPARGPATRLFRRLFYGGALSAVAAGLMAFGFNALNLQDQVCAVSFAQPGVSDVCGALRLGHAPTRAERLAWEQRPAGSCEALRAHVEQFPDGAYRAQAADLLSAARVERGAAYTPMSRPVRGYVRQSETPFPAERAARDDAMRRAEADARATLCAPQSEFERVRGVAITPGAFDCRQSPAGGHVCALDYAAECQMEERAVSEACG